MYELIGADSDEPQMPFSGLKQAGVDTAKVCQEKGTNQDYRIHVHDGTSTLNFMLLLTMFCIYPIKHNNRSRHCHI